MPSRLAAVSSFCPLPGGDPAISSHPVQHVQPWTGLVGLDFIRILGTPIPNSNPALFAKYVAKFCGRLFQNDAPVVAKHTKCNRRHALERFGCCLSGRQVMHGPRMTLHWRIRIVHERAPYLVFPNGFSSGGGVCCCLRAFACPSCSPLPLAQFENTVQTRFRLVAYVPLCVAEGYV